MPGALECVVAGFIPGGLKSNEEFAQGCVEFASGVSEETRKLLFDPQTAGGLLLSVSQETAGEIISALLKENVSAQRIGNITAKTTALISVV